MRLLIVCLCTFLGIFAPNVDSIKSISGELISRIIDNQMSREISPMEALDLVKERYAANFDKVYIENLMDEYYYKLPQAEYYLVYEDMDDINQSYIIHLYEFVLDEPDTGTGHFVTYGWYLVDKKSGLITKQTQ